MGTWTKERYACIDTWFSLFRLGQIKSTFEESSQIKMGELKFYNPASGPDHLKIEATLLADTIDRVFTAWGNRLEEHVSRNEAMAAMIGILLDKEKTIGELAETNDKNYVFFNESKSTP